MSSEEQEVDRGMIEKLLKNVFSNTAGFQCFSLARELADLIISAIEIRYFHSVFGDEGFRICAEVGRVKDSHFVEASHCV